MSETTYITTEQNQNNASTLACQTGGLVLVVGSITISNDLEKYGVWTITPVVWVQNNQSHFTSYGEVEYALAHTKIFYKTSFVSKDSFIVSITETVSSTSFEVVNFIAGTLAENKNFNIVIY